MKQVTRDVDLASVQDLLETVPRACLAFTSEGDPQVQPVDLLWQDHRYLVSFPGDAGRQPAHGQEVVLLVDDGIYLFDLRAIYVRGQVRPAEAPPGAAADRTWLEVVPTKTVAWDYGMLRQVRDEP